MCDLTDISEYYERYQKSITTLWGRKKLYRCGQATLEEIEKLEDACRAYEQQYLDSGTKIKLD